MIVLIHSCDPKDMKLEEAMDGYVEVELKAYTRCLPMETRLLCVRERPPGRFSFDPVPSEETLHGWKTPDSEGQLVDALKGVAAIFRDCSYRSGSCDDCIIGEEHDACEQELDEHFLDGDGKCVACRRAREYRPSEQTDCGE